jgi:hypothetical protein
MQPLAVDRQGAFGAWDVSGRAHVGGVFKPHRPVVPLADAEVDRQRRGGLLRVR